MKKKREVEQLKKNQFLKKRKDTKIDVLIYTRTGTKGSLLHLRRGGNTIAFTCECCFGDSSEGGEKVSCVLGEEGTNCKG